MINLQLNNVDVTIKLPICNKNLLIKKNYNWL